MGSSDFPSMNAKQLLKILKSLGYELAGGGKGSHVKLVCEGRKPLVFAFPKKELAGGLVKKILTKDVGLTIDEAKEAVSGK